MSELVSALTKFLEWQKEYDDIRRERLDHSDAAERLGLLLYGKDDSTKLIGGSNCLIFHDAAEKIDDLTARLAAAESVIENGIPKEEEMIALRQRLAAAEAERDVLLACRHGDQRCFECPDTKCCDNLNEAAKGVRDVC